MIQSEKKAFKDFLKKVKANSIQEYEESLRQGGTLIVLEQKSDLEQKILLTQ
jgi:hypothetical protein